MAAKTITQLLSRFNIWLRDGSNTTFSAQEKTEILTNAIDDSYVFTYARDNTTTTVAQQPSYDVPSTLTVVTDIGIDLLGDGYIRPIDRGAWDQVDQTVYFNSTYKGMPAGLALVMVGKYKLSSFDLIPDELQEYVLHLAMVDAYEMLKTTLATQFLTNDMTMGDLINGITTHQGRVESIRIKLANNRPVSF